MNRSISVLLIATFLAQTIGFGWLISWPGVSKGDLSVVSPKIEKKFSATELPATLTGNKSKHDYSSLVMVGDVLLARNVEYLMRSKGGEYPFSGVALTDFGEEAAVVGNFEASVPEEHVPTPIGMINFSVPTSSIPYLSDAQFTHMSLANNHSFDFEEAGLNNTVKTLSKYVETFGNPNEIATASYEIIEVDRQSVALIGLNGLLPIETKDLRSLFTMLSAKTDFQLVYIHWGEEYALRHSSSQQKFATELIDFGADLIVGHHPHVVQGVDLIDGVPVFYSLGNYIFDQYFSKDVQEGLIVSVNLEEGLDISLIPVSSKATLSQPNLMSEETHARWLMSLARKSHPDLRDGIETGRIDLTEKIATLDKVAIIHDTEAYVQ